MEITITGGAGFVGSHLANELIDREGVSVTVADLHPESPANPLKEDIDRKNIDVTDPETIDFEGTDAVVHLVAITPLNSSERIHQEIHVEGTRNIVRAAENAGVERFVHMSALGADSEGDTSYIRAKGRAEKFVESSDMDWSVFRPSVIFGPGDELVSGMMGSAGRTSLVPLPSQVPMLQPLYVKDVASMMSDAALGEVEPGQRFELGGPEVMDLKEMTAQVYRASGVEPWFISIPMPAVFLGLALLQVLPFTSYGLDQYRFLRADNVVGENDIDKFGLDSKDLTSLAGFLDSWEEGRGVQNE
ncbi:MAG: NAD(P)H-binding protein [Candidatus Nanohaloarchaea archaeon]|nr:NAD(P)H-binding protein [Candidatus Nanohaloarchaea archaeon]